MANRIHNRNVVNAISVEATAVGEYLTTDDGAAFRAFPANPGAPVFPTRSGTVDQMVGDGKPYDKQAKPSYYDALNKPYSGLLTSYFGARLLRMFLGGALTETDNTATNGTKDWAIAQLAPGSAPMVTNQIRENGGAAFLFGDVFTQTLEIAQTGAEEPTVNSQFSNGGHHIKVADTTIDTANVEAMDAYYRFDGKLTKLTFSDGTTSFDFAADGTLIDVAFTGSQNVQVEQLPGDLPLDGAVPCGGGYSENFYIDLQDANIRAKIFMDDTFAIFDSWKANKKLTSVTLTFKTCERIGAPFLTQNFELEIKFPIGEFNIEPDTQGNYDAVGINIKAIEGDPVTGSLVLGRVRMEGDLDEVDT